MITKERLEYLISKVLKNKEATELFQSFIEVEERSYHATEKESMEQLARIGYIRKLLDITKETHK